MKKRTRQEKQKANSTGRSYSAPKPVWELLLVRQLQIILGEKLFGPQAKLRITPIAWFEPATSMTSPALVARPRLPVDHLGSPNYNSINSRCGEFSNTVWGGEGEELCLTEGALERFRSRIKEMSHTKNRPINGCKRGILAYVLMADGLICWCYSNATIRKLFKEATKSAHWHNVSRQVSCIFASEDTLIIHKYLLLYVHFH